MRPHPLPLRPPPRQLLLPQRRSGHLHQETGPLWGCRMPPSCTLIQAMGASSWICCGGCWVSEAGQDLVESHWGWSTRTRGKDNCVSCLNCPASSLQPFLFLGWEGQRPGTLLLTRFYSVIMTVQPLRLLSKPKTRLSSTTSASARLGPLR